MDNVLVNTIINLVNAFVNQMASLTSSICKTVGGMDDSYLAAWIGVAGTLLGTILGWLLNSFSQKGKLNVFVTSWEDSFSYNNHGEIAPCSNASQAAYYSCKLALDIYNSSAETRIMRNIQIVFAEDKSEIRACTPDDCATQRFVAHTYRYDRIGPINVPPKTVINIELRYGEWNKDNSIQDFWRVNKVFLRYSDKNNKVKTIPISAEKYKDYFLNHKVEEKENG